MIESNLEFFWAAAGFMAGIVVTMLVMHLWRANERAGSMGVAALVALGCFGIYYWVGDTKTLTTATVVEEVAHPVAGDEEAGSMQEAADKLAAKLKTGNGSDADWELLVKTYEFLGDTQAAQLARQQQLKPGAGDRINQATTADEDAASILQRYQQLVTAQPGNASAWLAIAELQRRARQWVAAQQAYEKVIKLHAMNADAWANYADVRASSSSLSDAAVTQAIDAALRLDPQHAQALWLQASAAHEERRYADAVTTWRRLRAVLPSDSPDVAVIDANLAADTQLIGGKFMQTATQLSTSTQAMAQIQGTIEIDPKLMAQMSSAMTLFIYAKADDSPAPVAAYRGPVKDWPIKFVLDDSHAMMPARKLSMYPEVKIEARLSRNGQATASRGDLQADAVSAATRNSPQVTLRISRVVQ